VGSGLRDVDSNKPVNTETMFEAGSISKAIASMGAMWLVQQNRLSLDRDVNNDLTGWKVPENDLTTVSKVTLRGLLSHSAGLSPSGFRGYTSGEYLPTLVQVLNGEKPANSAAVRVEIEPGTAWRYSGGGYTVLQQLVEDVTGESFPHFMERTVFKKLDMSRSTYNQPLLTIYGRMRQSDTIRPETRSTETGIRIRKWPQQGSGPLLWICAVSSSRSSNLSTHNLTKYSPKKSPGSG